MTPRQVQREFENLIDGGAQIRAAGLARKRPGLLFANGLRPKHKIELFATQFYLTDVREIPELRFFAGYVVQKRHPTGPPTIYPRIFYKDLSLAWRSASHFVYEDDGDIWVGKGDFRVEIENDEEMAVSIESTTDLPLEMQFAMEDVLSQSKKAKTGNEKILEWVLRRGPSDRVEPYRDFLAPRRKAASNPRNLVNRGRSIARFTRKNDPSSLKIVSGFEPDFKHGVLEKNNSRSKLYGGRLRRFRILSANQQVQYYFIAGPKHVWIIPPQATTTQLSSYGVRTISVVADDDLFIPGYEYHHYEETKNGLELYSQIPSGFAGEVCQVDDDKADASPWLNKIPIIREFRQKILGQQ